MVILCLQLWKGADTKTKKLTHDEIKKKLIESLVMNDTIESDELTKKIPEVKDPGKAAEVIQECESIIRTKKKGIIWIAYHQGKVFKKFKDNEKFITLVNKLGIHKTTIILKVNIFKLSEKYPKLLNLSIGLGFFKNHYKDIKVICNAKCVGVSIIICSRLSTCLASEETSELRNLF